MSRAHPIVAITGSSGAGTTTVRDAFSDIFRREDLNAAFVDGDSFQRYERDEMTRLIEAANQAGKPVSHFGPETNRFDLLEALFKQYAEMGNGEIRHYVHDDEVEQYSRPAGTFTEPLALPENSDLLIYEGLHGGLMSDTWTRRNMSESHNPVVVERRRANAGKKGVDIAQYVDFLIGVVPVVNLEWIQKIHRDLHIKGIAAEETTTTILRRLRDYISFMTPQFSLTDINFQRVPLVDTSNPFISRAVPSPSESMLVCRFREPKRYDFPQMLKWFESAFMSRPNTLVIPGGKLRMALEVICAPRIMELINTARNQKD
jgi:phosphoribulokinase